MTDPVPASRSPAVIPAPGDRAVRLVLYIPQAALPKKLTLPTIADPWKTHQEENDTWVYRFMLETRAEVDAALTPVYTWGLKWDRIRVLGWGVHLFHNYVGSVLTCLQKSYASQDYRAHCWTGRRAVTMEKEIGRINYVVGKGVTKHVFDQNGHQIADPEKAPIVLHPCRYATGWQPLTTIHPAGIRAQIEAGLVAKDCRWCPRLDHLDQWEQQMWGQQHQPTGPTVMDDGRIH